MSDGKTTNENNEGSKYKDKDYIRVTTALGFIHFDPDDRLQQWMVNKHKTFADYREAMRQSAERGSWIDDFIKKLMLGEELENVPEEYQGYIKAFMAWKNEWPFKMTHADQEVSSETLKYVGTLDMRGRLNDKDIIIDIKTGKPTRGKDGEPKYEIFPKQLWQTAAYRNATGADENWVLRLFNDGNFRFVQDIEYEKSLEIFKHGLALARLLTK